MKTILLFLALAACSSPSSVPNGPDGSPTATDASSAPRILIPILGQSNAYGVANVSALTDQSLADPFPGVTLVSRLADGNAPPLNWHDYAGDLQPREDGFGVELSLGRGIPCPVVIAKMAVPGAGLYGRWKPSATADDPPLYAQARDWIREQEEIYDAHVGAIVWIQGNADANTQIASSLYEENLMELVSYLRVDFGLVPFVFDLFPFPAAYATNLRSEQAAFAAEVVDTIMIDTDALPHDDAHYLADGYDALGDLIVDALEVCP